MEDKFDIKVKSYASQPQMASYLMRAFLALRDRENASQSVKLMGSGGAIPFVILVTEIVRSRYQNVTSISEFESMEKDIDGRIISIPAIRVKLTLQPNEEDKQKPGYQPPTHVGEEKIIDLFDYVMLYTKDLYALKMHGKQNRDKDKDRDRDRRKSNNRDNKEYHNRDRFNYNRRGNQHERSQDWRKDREDFQRQQQTQENQHDRSQDWRKDREDFQRQHQQEENQHHQIRTRGFQRNNNNTYDYRESNQQRVSRPRDQQRQEQEHHQNQDQKLRQGAVIRRGGARRE